MDKNKFSAIAHKNHSFYNPISPSKLDKVMELLSLTANDKVVDIGAGKGELLIRISEMYSSHCTAIEHFGDFTEQLKENANNRGVLNNIEVINEDASVAIKTMNKEFNVGICIGSSHALGGYRNTIESLKNLVVKGGYIVLGELYWRKKPDEEYLNQFGVEEHEMLYHAQNIFTAEEYGLILLWSTVANEDDFDEYEWLYSKSIEDYCFENLDDPDCTIMLERIRTWRRMYLNWGRETLGFGIYIFRLSE